MSAMHHEDNGYHRSFPKRNYHNYRRTRNSLATFYVSFGLEVKDI